MYEDKYEITIRYFHNNQIQYSQSVTFYYQNYQNKWIFFFISFNLIKSQINIHISDQTIDTFEYEELLINQNYRTIMGDMSKIITNKVFRGNITKLKIYEDFLYQTDFVDNLQKNCVIPSNYNGEQTFSIISQFKEFSGNFAYETSLFQIGNKYCLTGWVKYSIQNIFTQKKFRLIRLSQNQKKSSLIKQGDNLFTVDVNIYKDYPQFSKINTRIDSQCKLSTSQCQMRFQQRMSYFYLELLFQDINSFQYFQGLQQWHYIQYEYGENSQTNSIINLQIFFMNELGLVQQQIFELHSHYYLTGMFYIYIGEVDQNVDFLQATLHDFKFSYNYDYDKEFNFECHYSCNTCQGPFINNCLSCKPNLNRIYNILNLSCDCLSDYFDIENQPNCLPLNQYFTNVKQQIIFQNIEQDCQLGYFKLPQNNKEYLCIECPQSKQNGKILCTECIFNPETWYLKPICKTDMIQYEIIDGGFSLTLREKIDFDVFFIDEDNLLQIQYGVEDFCGNNSSNNDCFIINKKHLSNYVKVKCKQNSFIYQTICFTQNSLCQQVDSYGICYKCKASNMYLYKSYCYFCPLNCKTCNFNIELSKVVCTSCYEKQALVQGFCENCGLNCLICEFNQNQQKLICLKCLDDQLYYISIDKSHCKQNIIYDCQYQIEIYVDNFFSFDEDQNNVATICGKCQYSTIYDIKNKLCHDEEFPQPYDAITYPQKCYYSINNLNDENICFIAEEKGYGFQFHSQCSTLIPTCKVCQKDYRGFDMDDYFCVICQDGYYSERLTGICKLCPQDLNCAKCGQQQKKSKDYWAMSLIFSQQSQLQEDYEIICLEGFKDSQLYQQKCIKNCHQQCVQCQIINEQNICIQCSTNEFGRMLSLSNNECIQCPKNCNLCRQRNQDEIFKINPLFNNQKYYHFSNQCIQELLSENDKKEYFSQNDINLCNEGNFNCYQQLNISINLYCNKDEYNQMLNDLTENQQIEFQQQNMLIDDFISDSNFFQFENDIFYTLANNDQIQSIFIQITSVKEQQCVIEKDNIVIQQIFHQNILFLKQVQLNLKFDQQMTFLLSQQIQFINFNQISISGLNILIKNTSSVKGFIFSSIFNQIIKLQDLIITQLNNSNTFFNFQINQFKNLSIINLEFINLFRDQSQNLFIINKTDFQKYIIIQNVKFNNLYLKNQIIFYLNLNFYDQINIYDIYLFGNMINSSVIVKENNDVSGLLQLKNHQSFGIIENSPHYLQIQTFQDVYISYFFIKNSSIINSNILNLNCFNILDNLFFENNIIINNSTFINNQFMLDCQQKIIFNNLYFTSNKYTNSILLLLKKYQSQQSRLEIQNLFLLSNHPFDDFDQQQQINNESLIYLEMNYINITNFKMKKTYGSIDLIVVNTNLLYLQQVDIQTDLQYKFQGIHKFMDCMLKQTINKIYKEAILIFSTQELIINYLNVQYVSVINFPIISYKSVESIDTQFEEKITLKNIEIANNQLIQTSSQNITSILFILTNHINQILFENITISNNILHEYLQSTLSIQSAIINLICESSQIIIQNFKIQKNLVLNSSDSVLNIICSNLTMVQGTFQNNNIYDFYVIQPYLLWGFENQNNLNFQILQNLFQVKSIAGVGIISTQYLFIQDTEFINASGQRGGFLYIININDAITKIINVNFIFTKLESFYNTYFGGAIYLNIQNSLKNQIFLSNIKGQNLYCLEQGGFLYIESGSGQVNIQLQDITIVNVYAAQGSFLYAQFSEQMIDKQVIMMKNQKITNSINGFQEYLSAYTIKDVDNDKLINLIHESSLIQISNLAEFQCQEIFVKDIVFNSFLNAKNILNIIFDGLILKSFKITTNLIQIDAHQYFPSIYFFSNIKIDTIQFGLNNSLLNCEKIIQNIMYSDDYKCLKFVQINPQISDLNFDANESKVSSNCIYNKLIQYFEGETFSNKNQGIIIINSYSNNNSFNFNNFQIISIDCKNCQQGLIFLKYFQAIIQYTYLQITGSQCGIFGCINIKKTEINRILTQSNIFIIGSINFEISLINYICTNNTSQNGVCLNIDNSKVLIKNSYMQNNTANYYGGAILITGQEIILIIDTVISNNEAQVGGGIHCINQNFQNQPKLRNLIYYNKVKIFGSNIFANPGILQTSFQQNQLTKNNIIIKSNQELIEQQTFQIIINESLKSQNYYQLPSGQSISKYQFFDWKTQTYISANLQFRINAFTLQQEQVLDLIDSECFIQSRKYNLHLPDSEQIFTNNYTNIVNVKFDSITQDYNLDNLIIYFDSEQPESTYLQLEINCSSILIPIYNNNFFYDLISQHQNYKLRVNILTFPCQFGEIKNLTDNSCYLCESKNGQYSLTLNSRKCEIFDEINTIEVRPAQINLKPGYWRPYFDTTLIENCLNLQQNCLGGWLQGDTSCTLGHLGALCEQCDIYNIRGDGHYSVSYQFRCGVCTDQKLNIIMITLVTIWIGITLIISTTGTIKIIEEYLKPNLFVRIKLIRQLNLNQSSVIMKMITYFQIITSITTFRLDFSIEFLNNINALGNPIQSIAYSFDCFLVNFIQFEICYARVIWQLITPITFFILFILFYKIMAMLKIYKYSKCVIYTSIIHLFLYYQPNLIGEFIKVISYRKISGFKWIQANVSQRYDTQTHYDWVFNFFLPFLLFLSLFCPCFLFWCLFRNRKKLDHKQLKIYLGYLYHEYKNNAYFWEIIKIFQKELIIIILIFYEDNVIIKGVLIQFVLYIYSELIRIFNPFYLFSLNNLDYKSANICMISFALAISAYFSNQSNSTELQLPFYILILILNLHFLKNIFSMLIQEYLRKLKGFFDTIRITIQKHCPFLQKYKFLNESIFQFRIKEARMQYLFNKLKKYSLWIGKKVQEQKNSNFNMLTKKSSYSEIAFYQREFFIFSGKTNRYLDQDSRVMHTLH